jgi:hypothetical protein
MGGIIMDEQKEYRPNHAMTRYLTFIAKKDDNKREFIPIIPQYERGD